MQDGDFHVGDTRVLFKQVWFVSRRKGSSKIPNIRFCLYSTLLEFPR